MMNVNTRSTEQTHTDDEVTEGGASTSSSETSLSGGLERVAVAQGLQWGGLERAAVAQGLQRGGLERAAAVQGLQWGNRHNPDTDVQLNPTDVPPSIESPEPDTPSEDTIDAIHHRMVEWSNIYQELSNIRAQLDQLPGANVINQQEAKDCFAQIAGGDIVNISEVNVSQYLDAQQMNLTLNQWNDFSPAVESIYTELLRAQTAQILPQAIAQHTQAWLDFALTQAHDQSNNAVAIQSALDEARQSLESYATQVVRNIQTELAVAKQYKRFPAYCAAHTKRTRGWLGIFVGIAKLILAIEFVSKLVPLLMLL